MRLSVFLLLLLPIGLAAQGGPLERYLSQGLASSQALKQQAFQAEKSLHALREARGLFFPSVSLLGSYTLAQGGRGIAFPIGDLLNPVYSTLNQLTQSEQFPQLDNFSEQLNPNNFHDFKFRLAQPLFNADIYYNYKIKEELVPLEALRVDQYRRELVRDIQLAYFQWLQASQAPAIYREALGLVAENIRVTERLIAQGMALPGALARASSERSRLEGLLIEAENQQRNAAAYLNFLINQPLDAPLEADSAFFALPALPEAPSAEPPREELAQLRELQEVQALSLQLARSYRLPKLSAFVDLGNQGFDFAFEPESFYYLGGLSLEWNVFSGMRNRARVAQAESDLASTRAQQAYVSDQIRLQVSTSYYNLSSARQLCLSAEAQSASARRAFADLEKRYREQAATYLELLDAQTAYTQARLQESVARFQVWARMAEYERAQASYLFSE
jgi:outer membrane protein TolC